MLMMMIMGGSVIDDEYFDGVHVDEYGEITHYLTNLSCGDISLEGLIHNLHRLRYRKLSMNILLL